MSIVYRLPPREFLRRFTSEEIAELAAYRRIMPFGVRGLWIMCAHVLAAIYSCRFGNQKLWRWQDFMPDKQSIEVDIEVKHKFNAMRAKSLAIASKRNRQNRERIRRAA